MNDSMETLLEYTVNYKNLNIQEPSTDLEKEILKRMCHDAAETIERPLRESMALGSFNIGNQE